MRSNCEGINIICQARTRGVLMLVQLISKLFPMPCVVYVFQNNSSCIFTSIVFNLWNKHVFKPSLYITYLRPHDWKSLHVSLFLYPSLVVLYRRKAFIIILCFSKFNIVHWIEEGWTCSFLFGFLLSFCELFPLSEKRWLKSYTLFQIFKNDFSFYHFRIIFRCVKRTKQSLPLF